MTRLEKQFSVFLSSRNEKFGGEKNTDVQLKIFNFAFVNAFNLNCTELTEELTIINVVFFSDKFIFVNCTFSLSTFTS